MNQAGQTKQAHRREFVGEVVSNKMQKTIVVDRKSVVWERV